MQRAQRLPQIQKSQNTYNSITMKLELKHPLGLISALVVAQSSRGREPCYSDFLLTEVQWRFQKICLQQRDVVWIRILHHLHTIFLWISERANRPRGDMWKLGNMGVDINENLWSEADPKPSKPIEVVVWLSALANAKESSREMGFQSFVSLQWLTRSKMNNIDHQHLSNIQSTASTALKCEAWYCLASHPSSSWWVASTSPCRIQWITATSLNNITRTHTIAIGCNGSFRIISVTSYMYGLGKLQWCQDELLEDPIWKEQSFSNHLTSKVLNPFFVSVWVVFDLDYT